MKQQKGRAIGKSYLFLWPGQNLPARAAIFISHHRDRYNDYLQTVLQFPRSALTSNTLSLHTRAV